MMRILTFILYDSMRKMGGGGGGSTTTAKKWGDLELDDKEFKQKQRTMGGGGGGGGMTAKIVS